MKLFLAVIALALGLTSACPSYKVVKVVSTSRNSAGLKRHVDRFRRILGGDDNMNAPGPLRKGQRSINWDADIVPFDMPFDFFQFRGALVKARGNKFAVSNPPDGFDDRFDSINPGASKRFITFSPKRLFTPVRDNKVSVIFTIPGSKRRASVSGFGAVFVDVDRRRTSFLILKDRRGCRIARVAVPPRGKGLSFVGVLVKSVRKRGDRRHKRVKAPVAKVDLILGDTPINKRKRRADFVVLDDFIYGEPQKL